MPVPTPDQFHAYATIHEQIAAAIAHLTPEQMRTSLAESEWSIHQVIIHLADSEAVVGYERLRRILAEEHPTLLAYDEAAWASNLSYHQQDAHVALQLFQLLRQANLALLQQLPASAWERRGRHSESGEMSLYEVFQTLVRHGEAHLQQIEQMKQRLASA